MRRTAICLAFLLACSLTLASQTETKAAKSAAPKKTKEQLEREAKALALFERAYGLGEQLSTKDQANLYMTLAQAAKDSAPQRSLEWAERAVETARQLDPGMAKSLVENTAISTAAETDSEKAMQLLAGMEAPPRDGEGGPNMRNFTALRVFQKHWQDVGAAGLETIRNTARAMGEEGEFPFTAIGSLAATVRKKDEDAAREMVTEAITFYRRSGRSSSQDTQFAMFLMRNRDTVPAGLLRPALESLVANALRDDGSSGDVMRATIQTDKGGAAFDKPGDFTLFSVLPLIRQVDSGWAEQLVRERPVLAQAPDMTAGGQVRAEVRMVSGPGPGGPNMGDLNEEMTLRQVDELSAKDPAEAFNQSQTLNSPGMKAAAAAYLAAGFSKSDPDRALRMADDAEKALRNMQDKNERLRVMAALARAYLALKQGERLNSLVQRAYEIGEQAVRDSLDSSPDAPAFARRSLSRLVELTTYAARPAEEVVMERIENVRVPMLQAHLLVAAGEGMISDEPKPRQAGMVVIEDRDER